MADTSYTVIKNGVTPLQIKLHDNGDGTFSEQLAAAAGAIAPATGTPTSKSGTIATANTSQVVANQNASRVKFEFQNQSSVDQWLSFSATATTTAGSASLQVAPRQYYATDATFCPSTTVSIACSTTGAAYWAQEK